MSSSNQVNILLVDDQPRNLEVLEAILASPEHRLVRATSGDEALLALMRNEFAAIVLDIQMPNMSGLDLARLIKQRKRNSHIPILFLTAHFLADTDVLEGYCAGAVDYLTKPFNPQILQSKVAVFVELFRTTRALAEANSALEAEIAQRRGVQEELRRMNDELEARVEQRTMDLSRSEEAYRNLVHTLPTAVYTCDAQGRIVLYNRAAVALWGREPDVSHDLWCGSSRIFKPDGSPWPLAESPMALTVQRGKACPGEFVIERPDGSRRTVTVYPYPLHDSETVLAGSVNVLVDVTEARFTEAVLREAKDEAESASKAKDNFLAALSHELRTPLNPALLLASERENDDSLIPDVREDFGAIRRDIQLEARLIDDLLDLTRISHGKLFLEPRPVDLHSLLQKCWERLKVDAIDKEITARFDLAPEPVWVKGDPVRLQQVLWNVMKNAVRFTPARGEISIRSAAGAPNEWRIEIADTGMGIEADELEKIFEPFAQGRQGSRVGGLGLGLAISRRLVELHGGRIIAQSDGVNCGSQFSIYLPSTSPREREPGESAPRIARRQAARRILLVEDHNQTRITLARLLTQRGHEVATAESVEEALVRAQNFAFDLVLSDLGLPDGSGHDLIVELRKLRPSCRSIALSGYGMESDTQRSMRAGFDAHLTKPIDVDALVTALEFATGS